MISRTTHKKTRNAPSDEAAQNRQHVLLSIAAATDSLWQIWRQPDFSLSTVLHERRDLYRQAGISWHASYAGGAKVSDRKGIRVLIDALGLTELVEVRGAGKRVIGARLTTKGDAIARATANLPAMEDGLRYLDALHALRDDARGIDRGGIAFTRETDLCNTAHGLPEAVEILSTASEALLAPMVAELVTYARDVRGAIWYGLTPAGTSLARLRLKTKPTPEEFAEPNEAAVDLYYAVREREDAAIIAATPNNPSELGDIPIAVCPETRGMIAARPPSHRGEIAAERLAYDNAD
jgi:hypothetical protein